VSSLVRTDSTERLLSEISRCEVVCSNCHRERTQRRLLKKQARARGTR
jgi:hypothetical protein